MRAPALTIRALPLCLIAALAGGPAAFAQPAPRAAQPAVAAPAPKPAAKPAANARQPSTSILPGGNSKDPISIDANKLEWFDADQKAVYTGDVVVIQGDSSLKAATLTIFLNKDEKNAAPQQASSAGPAQGNSQIRRMEAAGPVTVIQKDQVGTGDRGVYDKVDNKVLLLGNVTLSQGGNITTGEKLIYDLDTKQAVVESGGAQQRVRGLFIPGSGPKEPEPAPAPAAQAKGAAKGAAAGTAKPKAADPKPVAPQAGQPKKIN